jgi:hypothetical protein
MVKAEDIRDLRTSASDYPETERLKPTLRSLRSQRDPFFLAGDELEKVFRWKLRGQYGRQKTLRATNTPSAYKTVTMAAFAIQEADLDYEAELRLGTLGSLRGIGVPVASAILALADPGRYCVIDFRGWRAVFGRDRSTFEVEDYKRYAREILGETDELCFRVMQVAESSSRI